MNDEIMRKELVNIIKMGQAFVPLEKALSNIKSELRNKRPDEGIHSVWENLEHMRIAQEDILKYMKEPKWESPYWPSGYWPDENTKVDDEIWNKTLNEFIKDRGDIIDIINDEKINLMDVIPHTESHTYLREILLVAEHNAYHLGQIIMVRKLFNNW